MLKLISETTLTKEQQFNAHWLGWLALEEESGAFLERTNGRGKGGLPTYILILPNKTPEARGGLLAKYEWDYPGGRKFIREWTLPEAIATANKRLARMLGR